MRSAASRLLTRLGRIRWVLPLLALFGLLALAGVARGYVRRAESEASIRVSAPSSPLKLDGLSRLRFSDQQGQPFAIGETLKGQVWIFDFIFTTCTSACPLITSRFVGLQRRLSDPTLRFVSISVDPEHDTNTVLAQYAKRWAAGEARWLLLRPDTAGLDSLLSRLGVTIERDGADIVHTERMFLVDRESRVVGDYDSKDDAALARLVTAASEQLGRAPIAPSDQGETGAALFAQLGCAGCHADAQIAPPLAGLLGRHVMLERGGPVAIDGAYLRQSILDPDSQLVAGYPDSMPSYADLLTPAQVQRLVDFVASLPATAPTTAAPEAERATPAATDPVCGMPVRVTASSPSVDYRGQSYHFCSAACARRFAGDPNRYATAR